MPPAECDRAKEDRDRRRKDFGPDRESLSITREHRLYRCVTEKHIDYEMNKPKAAAFDQAGMSVFVEGPGFEPVNWTQVLEKKKEWIAVAAIDAAEILDNGELYKFELLHDPYGDQIPVQTWRDVGQKTLEELRLAVESSSDHKGSALTQGYQNDNIARVRLDGRLSF